MTDHTISVLVVDDEALIAEAHASFLARVPGFRLAGISHGGRDALRVARDQPVDLILLDFSLPDLHGLEVCRLLRAARADTDVIAVTANRDLAAVRSAVSLGVVQYLLKPFTFATFREKLESYADYRRQVRDTAELTAQVEVDRAFAALRSAPAMLPPGLTSESTVMIARFVQRSPSPVSAIETAEGCGVSRVTARRYLEHLAGSGMLHRRQRYGGAGRPEIEYEWVKS